MTYATRPAAAPPVKKPLTPKRPYRVVENDEYAAFLRRVIRAYSRRVASGDIEAITDHGRLADHLEDATRQAITGLRASGYSWADIAMRLGITRQGAQQRWGDTPAPVTDTSQHPRRTGAARDPHHRPCAGSRARNPSRLRARGRTPDPARQSSIPTGNPAPARPASALQFTDERIFAGLHHAGYDAWLDHVWHAAACTRPIRLRGDIRHIDPATGELLRTIPTLGMPDGVIYKPCGNRRATICPGCAETYRRDAYQLIRAGLVGGKGITPAVATHPAVFATFTAPSFGPVHARPVRQHTCADRTRCTCQPQPCHARRDAVTCEHGRPAACFTRHRRDDPKLGQPLCPDCYDYPAHVVWNNQAGELWRRTKQAIERHLNQAARHRGLPAQVRVAHGKAAEYQARGAVHFHALLRLDGYDPADPDRAPAPAARHHHRRPGRRHPAGRRRHQLPHPAAPRPARRLDHRLGHRDRHPRHHPARHRHRHRPGRRQLPRQVLHQGHRTRRARLRPHHRRDHRPVRQPRRHPPRTAHRRLLEDRRRTPATSACAAGPTCSASAATSSPKPAATPSGSRDLRQARITYRRSQDTGPDHGPIRTADHTDDETILIVGTFTYAGTGWKTTGDALLANTAADQARKRRQAGRDQLADEYAETIASEAA